MKRSAVVSIIGRPNVGKSTVFNRLMREQHKAMTHDLPGVTRDRHYGILDLQEAELRELILVDTGGFYPERVEIDPKKKNNVDPFFNIMAEHAKLAITESDLVLFVVDAREGLNPFDEGICSFIRAQKKPFWILVNKYDTDKQAGDEADFYRLGIDGDDLLLMSAEHNRGFNDLRTRLYNFSVQFEKLATTGDEDMIQKGVKPAHDVVAAVAIIGAPNAGKSTLLNGLVGAQRALVSEIAGTTVDPIEGYIDLVFPGEEVSMLTNQANPFRKDNMALYEEMKAMGQQGMNVDQDVDAETEEAIYMEYGQMAPEFQGADALDELPETEQTSEFGAVADFDLEDYFGEAAIEASLTADHSVEDQEIAYAHTPEVNWRSVKLVDTAGIRRSKKVEGFIEEQSVYRSLRAITESDVVIFMVDATLGITHQDRRLLDIALEKGKSLVICLNKIDLLRDLFNDPRKKKEWLADLKWHIPWLEFCQLVTISAKHGRNVGFLKDVIRKTILVRNRKIPTGQLNKSLTGLFEGHPIMVSRTGGTRFKLKYASMIKAAPPTFLLFTNKSLGIPEHYKRYLVNGLRKDFGFTNTPVHLIFRTSSDLERRMKKIQAKKTTK